ncbi:alpha/beta hydrolase [Kitasatospora sp. MAP5-34]|uniref:alpha/beta hydrolase family protein n=1 Tax=Kitasatospora sp. MAP5-34 TaxID=3035102 RepID=UPI00247589AC|nr:alpha/beta hydrolase [Kitasatospora sp. MAP5-34]MDH6579819.1 dienelactone hydrolase [Kitasatospora sp. MAP5-34]
MTGIRRAAAPAAFVLALALSTATAGAASAAAGPAAAATAAPSGVGATAAPSGVGVQLALPRPTSPHAVGLSTLHLVDADRPDPWVPAAGPRQLMVSVYYPARPGTGEPAQYMTTEEAQLLLQRQAPGAGIPPRTLSDTRTWARTGPRPAPGRFPLVLLSPGYTMPRSTLTSLAEDLASHGYVVALVNHTYEDSGTTFPDGRTLTCGTFCDHLPDGWPQVNQIRATDISFVIDQLTGHHSPWHYAHMIDPQRIGMAGHSVGGSSAASAMAADQRVRAGVDMDGTFDIPIPATGLDHRPFLLLGTQSGHAPGEDASWDSAWANLDGWKRWLTVSGTDHVSFTDLTVLASELNIPLPGATLPGQRAAELTRSYVAAFFDLQLKGIPQPLLDGPSPANPEVTFQHPSP